MPDDMIQSLTEYITRDILKQPNKALAPDAKIISSGLVDSFSLVDLAMFIEERYHVRIADTELNADTFDTIRELAKLIAKKM